MSENEERGRARQGPINRFLRGSMGAHVYIVCTVSLQETLYKNDFLIAEAGIGVVVARCSALMIAVVLFLLAQHRIFDRGGVRRRLFFALIYAGLSVALGIVTGYAAPPVFIRDQHIEFWGLYTLGVVVLFLAFGVMQSIDRKRPTRGGSEASDKMV